MSSGEGRNRGNDGIGAGSLIGWATPAATRLRFKTVSRGDKTYTGYVLCGSFSRVKEVVHSHFVSFNKLRRLTHGRSTVLTLSSKERSRLREAGS